MSKVQVVVGGQYGSEAKGAVAAYLSRGRDSLTAVRVAGPNAGHTVVNERGERIALRQIPVAAVTNPESKLVVAAGSEIDPAVLWREVDLLRNYGVERRLFVDGQATVITQEHQAQEGAGGGARGPGDEDLNKRIGSTAKGIGAARADRIWRRAQTWDKRVEMDLGAPSWAVPVDTAAMLRKDLERGGDVLIEGTQGFALGLHAGWYPFCTSSDCRVVDFLAMAGVAVGQEGVQVEPWVVLRTFPIRVAGNSGPMEHETTWENLELLSGGYIKAERTTVTQRIRRVGAWDAELAARGVSANGGSTVKVALSMFDYWYPDLAGKTGVKDLTTEHWDRVHKVECDVEAGVELLGTGPGTMIDLRGDR